MSICVLCTQDSCLLTVGSNHVYHFFDAVDITLKHVEK